MTMQDVEYVSICPACGEPIDYCLGHGEIGDPNGAAILRLHDNNRHYNCADNSDCKKNYALERVSRADGQRRMTNAQRDRLWQMCGNYNVPFNEADYFVYALDASMMAGYAEGWVGGKPGTIYVGVSPEGESHT